VDFYLYLLRLCVTEGVAQETTAGMPVSKGGLDNLILHQSDVSND
jgi:hypothetical protein